LIRRQLIDDLESRHGSLDRRAGQRLHGNHADRRVSSGLRPD
jgi:hypothetical protein